MTDAPTPYQIATPREKFIDKALMIAGTVAMLVLFVGAVVQRSAGV
jgi:hypothetical protein